MQQIASITSCAAESIIVNRNGEVEFEVRAM
jgi:hypothetical protein